MKLNAIKPAGGAKHAKKRVGRGFGCHGKTAGRGHKGQKARAGGYHKVGFEGGQMPLQRRLPKTGFKSRVGLCTQEIRLSELNKMKEASVSLQSLREAGLITSNVKFVKIVLSGDLKNAVTVSSGVKITEGAKKAVIAAGGKVEA